MGPGLKNLLDRAVVERAGEQGLRNLESSFFKVDEHLGTAHWSLFLDRTVHRYRDRDLIVRATRHHDGLACHGFDGPWSMAAITEHHEHEHMHEPLTHAHSHTHDEHHQHAHDEEWDGTEPHAHEHRHEPLRHRHPHFPTLIINTGIADQLNLRRSQPRSGGQIATVCDSPGWTWHLATGRPLVATLGPCIEPRAQKMARHTEAMNATTRG